MDQHIIQVFQAQLRGSADHTISFPQGVQMLMEIGVSRYHMDFVRRECTAYLRTGDSLVEPVALPSLPIAEEFSATEVAAAVKSSQTENQSFKRFAERSFEAGCVGYVAYLDGRRVVYTGRLGDEHTEWFPS